jgi:glycerol 3-phosphatase-2
MSDRLLDRYDAVLFDLDGTVYRGAEAIPGAAVAVAEVRGANRAVRFVTNNATRSPDQVAEHLRQLGIPADPAEVCTSAQAAAAVLAEQLPAGATVLVVGTNALVDEVREVGLRPVAEAGPDVVAVVQGLSQNVGWRELSEAVLAVRAGAFWVACNADPTLPTERGQLIGNGALVAAVGFATGREPVVAGKPNRPLMDQSTRSAEATKPLVVGDRLDTDIAGAHAAGLDALLVLSGSTEPVDVLTAEQRPTYVAADVTALTGRAAELEIAEQPGWHVETEASAVHVRWSGGNTEPDPLGLLRTLCARVGAPDGKLVTEDETARAALERLGFRDRLA